MVKELIKSISSKCWKVSRWHRQFSVSRIFDKGACEGKIWATHVGPGLPQRQGVWCRDAVIQLPKAIGIWRRSPQSLKKFTTLEIKSQVQCFSMQIIMNKCFLLNSEKKLAQNRLVVFEKNAKNAHFNSEKWRHRGKG